MNISTAALLNILPSKLDNNIKQKIQNTSTKEGQTDLSSLLKDRSVHTLLSDTLKELATGTKTKQNILNILQNSKHMFDLKSFSSDIKELSMQLDKSDNIKIKQQSVVLKEFFTNIKNIDNNTLKQNISNNGVMLESKLKDISQFPKDSLISQKLIFQKALNDLVLSFKSIDNNAQKGEPVLKELTDRFKNTTEKNNGIEAQVKRAVFDILNNTKSDSTKSLQQTISQLSSIEQKISKDIEGLNNSKDIIQIFNKLKTDISTIEKNGIENININSLKNTTETLSKDMLKADLKVEVKLAVQNILNNLTAIQEQPKTQPQVQVLNNLQNKISNIVQVLEKTPVFTQEKHQSTNLANLNNELINIQESIKNIENKGIQNINIVQLDQSIKNITKTLPSNDIKVEVKTAVQNLLNNIMTIAQNPKQQPMPLQLQNISNEISKINNMLLNNSGASNLLQESMQNNFDITKDLKASLLVIQESLDANDNSSNKELKVTVEKLISQIEFFQGLSYSTAANYSFIPFSWENLEDGDIRFKNSKDETFSCQINLNLKNYGEIKILLDLDNKNYLNVNVGIENELFKVIFQQNLQKLRSGLNTINLNLQSLNIFDLKEVNEKNEISNLYNSDESLNFGLDLKV
ncbi:MAG: flagellar hook-length control protein FliK [Campylobacterota bacterium]|nr:flagellar hook-length control protein FliK [Campylobacterota bacterium]